MELPTTIMNFRNSNVDMILAIVLTTIAQQFCKEIHYDCTSRLYSHNDHEITAGFIVEYMEDLDLP